MEKVTNGNRKLLKNSNIEVEIRGGKDLKGSFFNMQGIYITRIFRKWHLSLFVYEYMYIFTDLLGKYE